MNFTIKDINEIEKEIQINLLHEELIPHFEEAYKEYQKKIELPGFRKGKVSISLLKKVYGESIEIEKLEKLADTYFKRIKDEQNIVAIGTPTLVDLNYERGGSAMYKIKYEIPPQFELKDYKNQTFEKEVHIVTDEDIEEELKHILYANAEYQEAQMVTDENHLVTCDIEYLNELGEIINGKSILDEKINLREVILPEYKNALINISVGDQPVVSNIKKIDKHEDVHSIRFIVKKIEKIVPPPLTDGLISKITKDKVTNIFEFKKELRKNLQAYWDNINEKKLKDKIVEKIVMSYDFIVPPSMVENLIESSINRLKENYPNKQLPKNFDIEKYKLENYAHAVWQIRWFFISQQIINIENIKIEDTDLEKLVNADAERMGLEKERLMQYYKNSPSLLDKLLNEKLMSFLISNNNIVEKPYQLRKESNERNK